MSKKMLEIVFIYLFIYLLTYLLIIEKQTDAHSLTHQRERERERERERAHVHVYLWVIVAVCKTTLWHQSFLPVRFPVTFED